MTLNTSCYVCSYIHILRYTFHSIVCSCSVMKNYSRVFYNFKELSSCVCIRSCNSNCEQSCRCCPTCLPPLHAPRSWHVTLTQAIILQWLFLPYLDRADRDFGLGQIDAVRDHVEFAHNPFIVLVTFGEHCLHHLFPTIDHTNLHHFYPVFHQTCQEYGVKYKPLKFLQLCKGQFQLLAKNNPNPNPPEEVINWFCNHRTVARLDEALHYKPYSSIPDFSLT